MDEAELRTMGRDDGEKGPRKGPDGVPGTRLGSIAIGSRRSRG